MIVKSVNTVVDRKWWCFNVFGVVFKTKQSVY